RARAPGSPPVQSSSAPLPLRSPSSPRGSAAPTSALSRSRHPRRLHRPRATALPDSADLLPHPAPIAIVRGSRRILQTNPLLSAVPSDAPPQPRPGAPRFLQVVSGALVSPALPGRRPAGTPTPAWPIVRHASRPQPVHDRSAAAPPLAPPPPGARHTRLPSI